MTVANAEPNLREEYARYFFSVFDACLHQDEAGRRLAQQHLEDALGAPVNVTTAG